MYDRDHEYQIRLNKPLSCRSIIKHGRLVVVLGWSNDGYLEPIKRLHKGTDYRIHVFITDPAQLVDSLIEAIKHVLDNLSDNTKIMIHVPKKTRELIIEVYDYLAKYTGRRKVYLINDKCGPTFVIDHCWEYKELSIDYGDKLITANMCIAGEIMMPQHKNCAFQNSIESKDPERYKENIISNFKANTPLGILKSFKNEDDIWDYIMMENEWVRPKKDEDIVLDPVDITVVEGQDPVEVAKRSVKSALEKAGFRLVEEGKYEPETDGK